MEETKTPIPEVSNNLNQTVETQPVSPSTKRAAKLSVKAIIITLIFLLLAGGAAVGFTFREPLMILVSKPPPSPSHPVNQITLAPTSSPLTDWSVFEHYAFSFHYPSNLYTYDAPKDSLLSSCVFITKEKFESILAVKDLPFIKAMAMICPNTITGKTDNQRVKIEINGYSAIREIGVEPHPLLENEVPNFVTIDGPIDNVVLSYKPQFRNEVDSILSTFSFKLPEYALNEIIFWKYPSDFPFTQTLLEIKETFTNFHPSDLKRDQKILIETLEDSILPNNYVRATYLVYNDKESFGVGVIHLLRTPNGWILDRIRSESDRCEFIKKADGKILEDLLNKYPNCK